MKKMKLLLQLDRREKFILLEAYMYLAWARILKHRPFSRVAPSLGEPMKETSTIANVVTRKQIKEVAQAIHLMSKYTFWESECFVKAIAAMKMLERRNIECTLYLGTGKNEQGKLIAHAWLRSGSFYVTGAEVMEQFTVVRKFAKNV